MAGCVHSQVHKSTKTKEKTDNTTVEKVTNQDIDDSMQLDVIPPSSRWSKQSDISVIVKHEPSAIFKKIEV